MNEWFSQMAANNDATYDDENAQKCRSTLLQIKISRLQRTSCWPTTHNGVITCGKGILRKEQQPDPLDFRLSQLTARHLDSQPTAPFVMLVVATFRVVDACATSGGFRCADGRVSFNNHELYGKRRTRAAAALHISPREELTEIHSVLADKICARP